MSHPEQFFPREIVNTLELKRLTACLLILVAGAPLQVMRLVYQVRVVSSPAPFDPLQPHFPAATVPLQSPYSGRRSSACRIESATAATPERRAGSERQPE